MEFDLYEKVGCRTPADGTFGRLLAGFRVDTVGAAVALQENDKE